VTPAPTGPLAVLLARARAIRFGPAGERDAAFALVVRPDGALVDDGKPGRSNPDEELVAGAVADIVAAAHAAGGRRWAARGDQDQWHEGEHSEAATDHPVRLDSFVRGVLAKSRRALGAPAPADLTGTHRTPRSRLARAAIGATAGWTPAHFCHLFGSEVSPASLLDALDAPPAPVAVNYFRRIEPPEGVFAAGALVLAGDRLPLDPRRLHTAPHDVAATRTMYVRSARRYEVPPADGERAEAHA
jgi:hypothetical protein